MVRMLPLLGLVTLLAGCALFSVDSRAPQQGGEGDAGWSFLAFLRHLGIGVTWIGTISAITGIALRLLARVYAPLAGLAFVFTFIAIWGGAAAGVGSAVVLISDPWVLGGTVAAIAGGVLFWHWPDVRAAWAARAALSRKVDKLEADAARKDRQ